MLAMDKFGTVLVESSTLNFSALGSRKGPEGERFRGAS